MIETTILNYLATELDPVGVYMNVPENPTSKFVVLEKTGSSERNHIKSARVAIQSYGATLCDAAELNEDVKEAMASITTLENVSAVRLETDYNFTNTQTKRPRYQAVFNVTYC